MSMQEILRQLVRQRLDAAAKEIFRIFERTVADYEEALSRLRESERRHRELCAVYNCEVRLHRTDVPPPVAAEEVPRKWSSGVDQQNRELRHIKVEQEEVSTHEEAERLHGLEEEEEKSRRFPLRAFPTTGEADEDSPQLHRSQPKDGREEECRRRSSDKQMKTERDDGEDCGGPGPARNLGPNGHLEPNAEGMDSELSETNDEDDESDSGPETGDSDTDDDDDDDDDMQESLSDSGSETGDSEVSDDGCQQCERFQRKMGNSEPATFVCRFCGRSFTQKGSLTIHLRVHTANSFSCHFCGKKFVTDSLLKSHARVHAGEKPFSCHVCGKAFRENSAMKRHMIHAKHNRSTDPGSRK